MNDLADIRLHSLLKSSVMQTQTDLESLNTDHPHGSLLPSLLQQRLADWCSRGDQLVVGSLEVHELVVGSLFYHDAPGHDGDDVGVLDSGQAMGNNNAGATLPGFVQGLLHCLSSKTHTQEPSSLRPQRLYNCNFTVAH